MKRKIPVILSLMLVFLLSVFGLSACGKVGGNKNTAYTVTFNANGGVFENTGSEIYESTYPKGSSIFIVNEPKRDGYLFKGWSREVDGDVVSEKELTVSGNMTLYAKWNMAASVSGANKNANGEYELTASIDDSRINLAQYFTYDEENVFLSADGEDVSSIRLNDGVNKINVYAFDRMSGNEISKFTFSVFKKYAVTVKYYVCMDSEVSDCVYREDAIAGEKFNSHKVYLDSDGGMYSSVWYTDQACTKEYTGGILMPSDAEEIYYIIPLYSKYTDVKNSVFVPKFEVGDKGTLPEDAKDFSFEYGSESPIQFPVPETDESIIFDGWDILDDNGDVVGKIDEDGKYYYNWRFGDATLKAKYADKAIITVKVMQTDGSPFEENIEVRTQIGSSYNELTADANGNYNISAKEGSSVRLYFSQNSTFTFMGYYDGEGNVLDEDSSEYNFSAENGKVITLKFKQLYYQKITVWGDKTTTENIKFGGYSIYFYAQTSNIGGYTFKGIYVGDSVEPVKDSEGNPKTVCDVRVSKTEDMVFTVKYDYVDEYIKKYEFESEYSEVKLKAVKEEYKNDTEFLVPNYVRGVTEGLFDDCKNVKCITVEATVGVSFSEFFTKPQYDYSVVKLNFGTLMLDDFSSDKGDVLSITVGEKVKQIMMGNGKYPEALLEVINLSKVDLKLKDYGIDEKKTAGSNLVKDGDFMFYKSRFGVKLVKYVGESEEVTLPENYNGETYTVAGNIIPFKKSVTKLVIPETVTSFENLIFDTYYINTDEKAEYNLAEVSASTYALRYINPTRIERLNITGGDILYSNVFDVTKIDEIHVPKTIKIWKIALSADKIYYEGTLADWCGITFGAYADIIGSTVMQVYINGELFNNKTKLEIPYGVTSIGERAFVGLSSVTELIIPDTVEKVGKFAFDSSKITKATVPAIAVSAFDTQYLTDLTVTGSGKALFNNINAVENLVIGGEGCGEIEITKPNSYSWYNLKNLTLGKGVSYIGERFFEGASNLTEVVIPNTIKYIGEYAFIYCRNIASVVIEGGNNAVIEDFAFGVSFMGDHGAKYTCSDSALTSVIVGEGVTEIHNYVFQFNDTKELTLKLPKSIEYLGKLCDGWSDVAPVKACVKGSKGELYFESETGEPVVLYRAYIYENGRTVYPEIDIPSTVKIINSYKIKDSDIVSGTYTVPEQVTQINYLGMINAQPISLVVSANVKYMPTEALSLDSFENITIEGNTKFGFSEDTIKGKTSIITPFGTGIRKTLKNVTISANNEYYAVENGVLYNKNKTNAIAMIYFADGFDGSVTLANTVETISDYAFSQIEEITSIDFGSSLISIGKSAFYNTGITSLVLPDSFKKIGDSAFGECNITSIDIPCGVTGLEYLHSFLFNNIEGTFTEDGSLYLKGRGNDYYYLLQGKATKEYSVKEGVGCIYSGAIVAEIKTLIVPTGIESCYKKTSLLDKIIAPYDFVAKYTVNATTAEVLGSGEFNMYDFIYSLYKNLIIGDGFTEIVYSRTTNDSKANSNLKTVVIGENVRVIGSAAFCCYPELTDVTFKSDNVLTEIGNNAFSGRSKLTGIELPESVEIIGNYAFYNCTALVMEKLPDSLLSIGEYAFCNCDALGTNLKVPETLESLGKGAFEKCEKLSIESYPYVKYLYSANGTPVIAMFSHPENKGQTVNIADGVKFITEPISRNTNVADIVFNIPASVKKITLNGYSNYNITFKVNVSSAELADFIANAAWLAGEDDKGARYNTSLFVNDKEFDDKENVCTVRISDGTKEIGLNAFKYADKLIVPESVERISSGVIPASLCVTDGYGYYIGTEENPYLWLVKVSGLRNTYTVNENTKHIADGAFSPSAESFSKLGALREINLPSGLLSIGTEAFKDSEIIRFNCSAENVTVGENAFFGCYRLSEINASASLTEKIRNDINESYSSYSDWIYSSLFFDKVFKCKENVWYEDEYGYYIGTEQNRKMILVWVKALNNGSFDVSADTKVICKDAFSDFGSVEKVTLHGDVFGKEYIPATATVEILKD